MGAALRLLVTQSGHSKVHFLTAGTSLLWDPLGESDISFHLPTILALSVGRSITVGVNPLLRRHRCTPPTPRRGAAPFRCPARRVEGDAKDPALMAPEGLGGGLAIEGPEPDGPVASAREQTRSNASGRRRVPDQTETGPRAFFTPCPNWPRKQTRKGGVTRTVCYPKRYPGLHRRRKSA